MRVWFCGLVAGGLDGCLLWFWGGWVALFGMVVFIVWLFDFDCYLRAPRVGGVACLGFGLVG